MPDGTFDSGDRKAWMSLLATAPAHRLIELWAATGLAPDHHFVRPPEIGTTMVRGRAGAVGAPFNLGEVTITRCSVTVSQGTTGATGAVGHAYVQGRDPKKAEIAALIDALMQTEAADTLHARILAPLAAERDAHRRKRAAKADATRVEFFTMMRGESE